MFYIQDRKTFDVKIQAPFVMATIRALRSSIFKGTPEIQRALAIAAPIERKYDLNRTDLYLPALESSYAILEPLSKTMLTGTIRRVGYELFSQVAAIAGGPAANVKAAMGINTGADIIQMICHNYSQVVIGSAAGALAVTTAENRVTVTDTTWCPCQLQMGVFLGGGQVTGMFRDTALVEKRCRSKGDPACVYEFNL